MRYMVIACLLAGLASACQNPPEDDSSTDSTSDIQTTDSSTSADSANDSLKKDSEALPDDDSISGADGWSEDPDTPVTPEDTLPPDSEPPETVGDALDDGLFVADDVDEDMGTPDVAPPIEDTGPPPDPCENVACPAVAECVEGTCVCGTGYESDGNNGCKDVDECQLGNTGCDNLAGCINLDGSYTCGSCPAPYDDVNGNGTLCSLAYNACGLGRYSTKASGSQNDALNVPYLPMVDHNTTATSPSDAVDTYDCAPNKLETGPEIFYRFVTEHAGTFHAELTDPKGVDIDIHLVQNPGMNGTQMTGCIARAHEKLTVENLPAGEYWVVADTWSDGSKEFEGSYSLAFEWTATNVWSHVPIDNGITWSRLRIDGADGDQTINRVRVDMSEGWDVQAEPHQGCKSVATVQETLGALVGINGTFYGGGCSSLGMIRTDGVTHSTNTMTGYEQRTIGWNQGQTPVLKWLQPEEDWTEVSDAIGGYPSLVTDGVGLAEALPGSQVWSEVDWQKHPRSIAAVDGEGRLVLMTFDGRTAAGDGYSTPDLAKYLEAEGMVQAMNLDGGGSTTMTIHDCWLNHVVNYPSDNKKANHEGSRKVANGVYVR